MVAPADLLRPVDWALRYARLGFLVLPIRSPTKFPWAEHGAYSAENQDERVEKLFANKPDAGVALAMGSAAGRDHMVVCVDIDVKSGGPESWVRVIAGRELPDTLMARSGSGGTHLFYRVSNALRAPFELAPGVELLGPGRYVLVEPSVNAHGGEYRWECALEHPIALAPEWLVEIMGTTKPFSVEDATGLAKICEGRRRSFLLSRRGSMLMRGFSKAQVFAALQVANEEQCEPPLSVEEVRQLCFSVDSTEKIGAVQFVEPGEPIPDPPSIIATPILGGVELAKALPPLAYFCESLGLPRGAGAPHIFGGFGFSGKTLVHQMLNLALASGRNAWKAFATGDPVRVTHVDNEQGLALTQRRYQRGARAMGVSLEEIGDYLKLVSFPRLRTGQPIKLVKEHRSAWLELMAERDMLMVDSLDASRGGQAKQSDAEVREALDLLGGLSEETACRGSVVHHANKASLDEAADRDPRTALAGSQGIYAASDSVYLLSGSKGEAVRVAHIKARSHGEPVADFALIIADVLGEGDEKWGLSVCVAGTELIDEQRAAKVEEKRSKELIHDCRVVIEVLTKARTKIGRDDLMDLARLNGARFSRTMRELGQKVFVESTKVGRVYKNLYSLGVNDDGRYGR